MHTLVYLSAATHLFSNDELVDILKLSRVNNARQNITGVLLYHEGSIIQILEGDKDAIDAVFNKISKDIRHKGIIKTLDVPIKDRSFPDWSMGFQEISNQNWVEINGYFNLSNKKNFPKIAGSESDHIISMIRSFANVTRLNLR